MQLQFATVAGGLEGFAGKLEEFLCMWSRHNKFTSWFYVCGGATAIIWILRKDYRCDVEAQCVVLGGKYTALIKLYLLICR